MAKNTTSNQIYKNKKAEFEFHLLDTYTAGVVLTGTEVKSIRDGKLNISDAFCAFEREELYVRNLHISEYKFGSYMNHEPKRARKLLLKSKELQKILNKVKEKGLTVVPTKIYFSERGFIKIDIAVAKGKKLFDKRDSIKEKDVKRASDRNIE